MIGKKGNTIQGIMEKSRVLNVKIMGDDEAKKKNIDTKDKVMFTLLLVVRMSCHSYYNFLTIFITVVLHVK